MERGVLYITGDDAFLDEARRSARSVKRQMPDLPIAIVTDAPEPDDVFDVHLELKDPNYGVVDKAENIHRSPFDRTLYLDTDTYVTHSLDELFELLGSVDVAAAHTPRSHRIEIDVPNSFPQHQAGVIGFRDTAAVEALFDQWRELYEKHRSQGHDTDQPSFRQALYETDVDLTTLRPEYNCLIYFGDHLDGHVRIVHGRADDLAEFGRRINQSERGRVFTSVFGHNVRFVDSDSLNLAESILFSLETEGVVETSRRAVKFGKRWLQPSPDGGP